MLLPSQTCSVSWTFRLLYCYFSTSTWLSPLLISPKFFRDIFKREISLNLFSWLLPVFVATCLRGFLFTLLPPLKSTGLGVRQSSASIHLWVVSALHRALTSSPRKWRLLGLSQNQTGDLVGAGAPVLPSPYPGLHKSSEEVSISNVSFCTVAGHATWGKIGFTSFLLSCQWPLLTVSFVHVKISQPFMYTQNLWSSIIPIS